VSNSLIILLLTLDVSSRNYSSPLAVVVLTPFSLKIAHQGGGAELH